MQVISSLHAYTTPNGANWPQQDVDANGAQDFAQAAPAHDSGSAPQARNTLADMARTANPANPGLAAVGNAPSAANQTSALNLDDKGHVRHERVLLQTADGDATIIERIEHGNMPKVNGIVIHQTGGPTVDSAFNTYKMDPGKNGAHFLIDRDGTIYQTASLHQTTRHVGRIRSRCEAEQSCPASGAGPSKMNKNEQVKQAGDRYPSNQDAIGIELVGRYHETKGLTESIDAQGQRTVTLETVNGKTFVYERVSDSAFAAMKYEMTQKKQIYEAVTPEQNASLQWLTNQLQAEFGVEASEIFQHPTVSYKNMTEALTARWH